ncbi:Uma2 family endonuclease, partial [Klebsiella pneumoniae]|uniref:Uma2 family endonuclease n=1 Tax=Klebsiella pneumoniae TaxID=573 RepID=UPI003EE291E0
MCEVLSPSTAATDRADKMPIYLHEGVMQAWLIDPAARTLEVFRRTDAGWLALPPYRDDAHVRAEPFEAIELEL